MNFTKKQKKILNNLLDKYETSKSYRGTNKVVQNIFIKPKEVWFDYNDNFTNVEEIRDFEAEIQHLQDLELIRIEKEYNVITKIFFCKEKLQVYYDILQRKERKDIEQEQINFFEEKKNSENIVISSFCTEQIQRIQNYKKPLYSIEESIKIFNLIDFAMNNSEEMLEREFSILLLNDSKIFKKKYKNKICKIILSYIDFHEQLEGIDDSDKINDILLEEYKICKNPTYIYLKGNITLTLEDNSQIHISKEPIAISSMLIKKIKSVIVHSNDIATIENLTSFNRINDEGFSYIFLSGYHNSEKQAFIKRIDKENPYKKWYHFGDIDPDGLYILEHLKRGTGIDFEPLYMGCNEIKEYSQHCKPLEEGDIIKAKNLLSKGKYKQILEYLLENNCKLEQEIISLYKK